MADVFVKGGKELDEFLKRLPSKIEKNILRSALRAGATVFKADAVAKCPSGPTATENKRLYGGYEGALRDSIRVTTRHKGVAVSASLKAGGKRKGKADVWYAHIIEYTGAKAHEITGQHRSMLFFGGRFVRSVNHPGMNARPFMRPSFHKNGRRSIQAVAAFIKRSLTKKGLDTSAINTGDEE